MNITKNIQNEAFFAYEANSWTEYKEQQLTKIASNNDPVLNILKDYQIHPRNCLEIGTSTGFRLTGIQRLFPACQATGVDSSKKAIIKGKNKYPNIQLMQREADDLSCFPDESFDLLIGSFSMYVVDRMLLLKVVAEMDRVLEEHGRLILIDFFPVAPPVNECHPTKPTPSFSYKQNYEEIFRASGLYRLWHKETINDASCLKGSQKNSNNNLVEKACITALIKGSKITYE